ncbi:MAG: hypothetical protein V3V22_09210 [Methylococcales bacterium]
MKSLHQYLLIPLCSVLLSCGGGGSGNSSSTVGSGDGGGLGGGGNGGGPDLTPSGNPTWSLEGNTFTGGIAQAGSLSPQQDDRFDVFVIATTGLAVLNGAYSGSSLSITHSNNGSGVYTVVDSNDFAAALANSALESFITIRVDVGTIMTNPIAASSYEAQTGGAVTVTLDTNGLYHFTASDPLVMTKSLDLGTGVPGSPDQASLTITNLYDFD